MATVRTRKRGKTYSYIFEAGKTPEGKRKVVEKGGFATKEEAYKAGSEAFVNFQHGDIGITSEKLTVAEYLDVWLKAISSQVRDTTKISYTTQINNIKKYIGNVGLSELRPRHIDQMFRTAYSDGKAHSTLNTLRNTLSAALKYAVYPAELISSSPLINIKIPNNAPKNVVKRTVITPEQFSQLVKIAKKSDVDHLTVMMILYHTGMRVGEVFGLMWDNINFKQNTIEIKYQRLSQKDKYLMQPLKTESSYRTIYMDSELAKYLKRLLSARKKAIADKDIAYYRTLVDSDNVYMQTTSADTSKGYREVYPVICNTDGKLFTIFAFRKFLQKHNLNSHSFRHTQATLLAEVNSSPKSVAARLGHKSTAITQDLYTHVTDAMQQEAMQNFESIVQTKS